MISARETCYNSPVNEEMRVELVSRILKFTRQRNNCLFVCNFGFVDPKNVTIC